MSTPSRAEFSFRGRSHNLARLRAELFDILVIGGGITGAGIARDAALRGYKVALLEKEDFAGGTSSRSTKLVHAGLRYLETYQFHLVYEASRERRILHQIAPNLVRPLSFLYPIYRGARYGPFLTRLGFMLYDTLALYRNFGSHHILTASAVADQIPALDVSAIVGGATYFDGQTDDARLTLENVRAAHRQGAVAANYFQVDALRFSKGGRREEPTVSGVQGHDVLTGEQIPIRARVVVNATGPWSDTILSMDHSQTGTRVKPSKGVHAYVPRTRLPIGSAVAFRVPFDNRLMFAIPWAEQILLGTTDTFYEGSPDEVYPDPEDIAYILRATNLAFPKAELRSKDITSAFAGLRPLIATGSAGAPGAISREHKIWTSPSGLVNIAGGKLTTYRSMAAEVVDLAAKRLKKEYGLIGGPEQTGLLPLTESDSTNARSREAIIRSLPQDVVGHLYSFYGARLGRVLDYIEKDSKWGQPVVEGLPYIWAEVPHALDHEMAMRVGDVLGRRMHLAHEAPDGAVDVARRVAELFDQRLDWGPTTIDRELLSYWQEVDRMRRAIRQAETIVPS